jgi:MFS family permease
VLLLRVLSAFAASLVIPSTYALLFEVSGKEKGKLMGSFWAVEVLGRTIGPVIGGLLYSFDINFPWLFLASLELFLVPLFYISTFSSPRAS